MPMMIHRFRFAAPPDQAVLRARLADEIGRRRADPRNLELEWRPDDGVLDLLSMDAVALVYAAKVCVALGAAHVPLTHGRAWQLPAWTRTRWIALPWTTRLRLWIGPTRY